jgi:hypothetical protein
MVAERFQQDSSLGALTLSEIVRSPEWELVEAGMRVELQRYIQQLTSLDSFDTRLAQKSTALSAKIQALKSLARHFYRAAGLDEKEAEQRLTGGSLSE